MFKMRQYTLWVVAIIGLLTLAFQQSSAETLFECPALGKVSYYKQVNDQYRIFVMSLDGSRQQMINTGHNNHDITPDPSNDGTRVAFINVDQMAPPHSAARLCVYNFCTGILDTLLDAGYYVDWPRWSPDDSTIAFTSYPAGASSSRIWLINSDGTNLRQLINTNLICGGGDWSPDGSRYAFGTDSWASTGEAYYYDFRLDTLVQLTFDGPYPSPSLSPYAWSPCGDSLLCENAPFSQLVTIDIMSRTTSTVMTNTASYALWGTDGRIYYCANSGGNVEVFSMNSDGSDIRNISNAPGDEILTGAQLYPCRVSVALDIKPGSCPNPLNVNSGNAFNQGDNLAEETEQLSKVKPDKPQPPPAVVPVAILGTENFSVSAIVPSSILLKGVPALRWNIEDVATPVGNNAAECECNTLGADGYPDLTLKFSRTQLIAAIGDVQTGDVIPLTLSGELSDGTPIEGRDCMVIVGSQPSPQAASSIEVMNSYPNPFNPATTIAYSISQAGPVALEIYNVLGERVRTLVDQYQAAGNYEVRWDSRNDEGTAVSSGIYFYRLKAVGINETKKMVLMK